MDRRGLIFLKGEEILEGKGKIRSRVLEKGEWGGEG